jgi:hypothetical protein
MDKNIIIKKKKLLNILENITNDLDLPNNKLEEYFHDIISYPEKSICRAKKQDGYQCTRKSRVNSHFCGKHIDKRKYGCVSNNNIELNLFEYDENNYYLDEFNIVYSNYENKKFKIVGIKKKNIIEFI